MLQDDCICSVNEIELFDPIPKQVVLEHAYTTDIHPINNLSTDVPIEFEINGSADEYIDLNSIELSLIVKVVNKTGDADIGSTDIIAPVNNWMHSMFQDVSLTIGDTVVEGGNFQYPYKAYLSNLLNYDQESKRSHVKVAGWDKDTATHMNGHGTTNIGFTKRKGQIAGSASVALYGPLILDMFLQQKYLLHNTNVKIKLSKALPTFQIGIYTADTVSGRATAVKVIIEKAILYVRKAKALPSVIAESEEKLNFINAMYPINRTQMTTYTINKGSLSHTKQSLFKGRMPKLVFVALVRNDAYNGSYKFNPFNFEHFKVSKIGLYNGGTSVPFPPYEPDFAKGIYAREYYCLLQSLGLTNKKESNDLQISDFGAGYTIFGFNLTPDLSVGSHAQVYREADMKLELQFTDALAETINVIIMGVFDGRIDITKERKVLCDWK